MKLKRYGVWCKSEDVEKLEAELARLRPKTLSAEEVTETGFYWWAMSKRRPFCDYPILINKMEIEKGLILAGVYVGPLKAPDTL